MDNFTEMGWDDVITEESSFVLLPEGDYSFTVKDFKRERHIPKSADAKLPACNKAVLTIEVDGKDKGKATITHNLFLHQSVEGLLSAFFISIGQKKHGEPLRMDWSKVVGANGRCKVGIRSWENRNNGEKMQSNEIKRFLEPRQVQLPPKGGF